MRNKILLPAGILLVLLGAAMPVFSSDQSAAPGGKPGGRQEPAPSGATMVLTVLDPRSSATITIPIFSTIESDRPVAMVNNEPITVGDLRSTIVSIHEAKDVEKEENKQTPKIDFMELLQRLINAELILQEARSMGLDELPEVRNSATVFRQVTLRSLMRDEIVKNVTADDKEVEKLYKESVKEVKTDTAFFEKEEDAAKAASKIKAGKSFDEVIAEGKKDGTIKGTEMGEYTKVKDLNPAIAKVLKTMKVGSISPVTKVILGGNKTYFALLRFDEERLLESPEAREHARATVLSRKRADAFDKFNKSLYKKYAKTDKNLLKSLDYSPKGPGLEKLMADQRVVARIKGGQPVTVAQLSAAMQEKFFHGMKKLKGQKMVTIRDTTLEEIVKKQLLLQEALRHGLDKSDAYKMMYKDFERDTLFGIFIEKAVVPQVKMTEDDLQAYYREHAGKYKSAVSMRLGQLFFTKKEDALSALDRLKKGGDFGWIKANAEGQIQDLSRESVVFEDDFIPFNQLPTEVQGALAGAQTGDFRLFGTPEGTFQVLYVKEEVPARQQEFEEVRGVIRQEVFNIKLNAAVTEWVRKLKESAEIKIYLSRSER